jgi:5'-nucleotidase
VNLALDDLMPSPPDLVFSGINHGPNTGSDVLFSGTAAGARQAALRDVTGVALSIQSYQEPFYFEPVVEFVALNLERFLSVIPAGQFLNINFPNSPEGPIRPTPAHLGLTTYRDRRMAHDINGKRYHFWSGGLDRELAEKDLAAVLEGYTTFTLVQVMPAEGSVFPVEDLALPDSSS